MATVASTYRRLFAHSSGPGFRLLVSADQAKTVAREKECQATVFGVRLIDSIAEDYVERAAALDPAFATFAGIAGTTVSCRI